MRSIPQNTRRSTLKIEQIVRCRDGRWKKVKVGRKQSMAMFCTECLGFEGEVTDCTSKYCPMYAFRARTLSTVKGDDDSPNLLS